MSLTLSDQLRSIQNQLASQLSSTDYDNLASHEKFSVAKQILIQIGATSEKLNRWLLPILWEAYINGDWQSDNPLDAFQEWVRDDILAFFPSEQRSYITGLSAGVRYVLATAYSAEALAQPIIDEHGEIVSVQRLLDSPSKVKEYAYHISKQEQPESWIALLPVKTREELSQIRGDQIEPLPVMDAQVFVEKGGYRIELFIPSRDGLYLVERLLKRIVRFSLPKGA